MILVIFSFMMRRGRWQSLELIGYRVDALPTASQPLQLTLWWRGMRPAAEDWTAFFHLTPLGNDHELLGRMGQAITAHAYPLPVWSSPGEVVVDYAQFSAANLAAGSYVVWMGMYPPFTKVRATVAAEIVVVSEARARLVEFQLAL